MASPAHRPAELHGRVFRGRQAVERGLLTRRQLESTAWRPLLRGTYADACLPVTHGLYVRAAQLLMPSQAVIAGRSAAWVYGVGDICGPTDPVEVLVPVVQRFGPIRGIDVRTVTTLAPEAVRLVSGTPVTAPLRTVCDIARHAVNVQEAVVALDSILAERLLSSTELQASAAALYGGRGAAQARAALRLADGRSESPQESRLRVGLVMAGLPAPVPQHVVRDGARFVARVNLAYPHVRLAIEYDGRWHGAPAQLAADRRRLNALLAAGWRVIHVTAEDLHRIDGVVAAIRRALAS